MKRFKIILSWSFVLAVMLLIFQFSGEVAAESDETSGSFISAVYKLYLKLTGIPCSTANFESVVASLQNTVRKLAHFCIYLTLGFLFSNAYYQTGVTRLKNNMIFALTSSAIYAATDEIHQLFVEGRSGEIRDVLIDSTGALTGIVLFILILIVRRKIWISRKQ